MSKENPLRALPYPRLHSCFLSGRAVRLRPVARSRRLLPAENGGSGPRWKLALLDAIEAVKADTAWQGILGEIIGVQGLACETQAKKTQDIQRFADPRNITPSELAVEREYEPKFRDIQNRLKAALDRANAHITKSSPGNLQSQYMHMQADKIVHATCTINVPRPPDDTDDPADP